MAGGKETPRQKLIGMMYLVLTALLALQVQSAVILKFKFIDDSLVGVNNKTEGAASKTVEGIQNAVLKNKNTAHDRVILQQSQELRDKTKEVIAYLRDVRDKLVVAGGNPKGSTEYHDINADNIVGNVMIGQGGKKTGLAYPLKNKLNEYSSYLKGLTYIPKEKDPPIPLAPDVKALALDAKDDMRVVGKNVVEQSTRDQKTKDFAELNFEATPLAAALATLSQKETEILEYEAAALRRLSESVGASTIVFDKLGAFAAAESNTVAAGTKYKAELFMTAAATGLKQSMTMNGSALTVDPRTNHGKVEFTARPGNFDASGNAKATWSGSIRINNNGRDTTYKVTVPYIISKPVMQIQSASVQALYLNCGNKLSVQVPALGAQYRPSFSASGASVIPGGKTGDVTLVPNSSEVKLNVASEGNAIGSQTFKVRQIPPPEIKCFASGREVDVVHGTPGFAIRSLQLRAVPDASFLAFLPDDARYRVSSYDVTLVRGRRPAMAARTINGPSADLTDLFNAFREGDRLVIQVTGVQRRNFRDQTEEVRIPTKVFNIPLLGN